MQHTRPDRHTFASIAEDFVGSHVPVVQGARAAVGGLLNKVRTQCSGDRMRLKEDGFDLDLSYVTPRIIAMGFPASGVEAVFRNRLEEVSTFLEQRHSGKYSVYNLSGRQYDYSKLANQVLDFPFPDHFPPTLEQVFRICYTLHAWLSADADNVAVVHCLAGKGRTGTVVASYLLFSGACSTPDEALASFAARRSLSGVTMPSQRRYVHYFAQALPEWRRCQAAGLSLPDAPTFWLKRLVLTPVPSMAAGMCTPYIQVLKAPCDTTNVADGGIVFSSAWASGDLRTYDSAQDTVVIFPVDILVAGDMLIRCYNVDRQSLLGNHKFLFRVSFNTAFVDVDDTGDGVLRLSRAELDEASPSLGEDFCLDVCLSTPSSSQGSGRMSSARHSLGGSLHKEGNLWKRGEINTQFQKRWFRLQKSICADSGQYTLRYFRDPGDPEPRGEIDLSTATDVDIIGSCKGYECCFQIVTPERTYVLCPDPHDDKEEMMSWISILIQCRMRFLTAGADAVVE